MKLVSACLFQAFLEPRHDLDEVAGTVADVELVFEDAVTAYGSVSQRFAASDGDWQETYLEAWQDIEKTGPGDLIIDGWRIVLHDDVDVTGGSLEIGSDYDYDMSDYGTTSIRFDGNLTAEQNVTLTGNEQWSIKYGHQTVIATNGKVSVLDNSNNPYGHVDKYNGGDLFISGGSDDLAVDIKLPIGVYNGNLWLIGNGDIQVSGDLTTADYD